MHIVPNRARETSPTRMAELDTLPVFYRLTGKAVLVAGGTDAAAWKAELLAAAGAEVAVFAPLAGCSDEMATLAAQRIVQLHDVHWSEASWASLAMAVSDCEDDREAAAFAEAARKAGVPVNVIDKPAFCQFQFGSIVNRSPVVVGISTSGGAPILAQAVRRRIETLLPVSLAGWAKLAQSVRKEVTSLLGSGAQRRAFWQEFAEAAFRGQADTRDTKTWLAGAKRASSGRVTLVGAGPGDAEYLTIKAVRALQAADVILFDDLVSDDVLELARREAKRILVGKRGRRESCRQEDINATMISLARQGRHVVRLKSGDPMIFGRAGEEIFELTKANIPVEVVPGISTAFALAAELRLSLTHRDHAQSVRFVTGHARNGELPANLDWRALADPATTHVYYMSGRTAGAIAGNLLQAGMAPQTPVVLASNVSRNDQEVTRATLDTLPEMARRIDLDAPIVIAIGNALAPGQKSSAVKRKIQ